MLGDLAVPDSHDVDSLELNCAACWRDAKKLAFMSAMIGFVGCHAVAVGKLPMDLCVEVRERRAENFVKLACAGFVRSAPRLRGMVEEIIGEEFIKHVE